jgi:glycosyltransferase involved in cell wall biosynthesis
VLNANGAREEDYERSALMVYLPDAFLIEEGGEEWRGHQNRSVCKLMARVLGEMGYLVDVVHKHDRRFRPRRPYDLVVSERLDWHGVEALLPRRARHVFLATSIEHRAHNQTVAERHRRLAERRPGSPELRRRTYGEHAPAAAAADALTGPGNARSLATWSYVCPAPALPFKNFPISSSQDSTDRKHFGEARKHFLFFASRTQVQKGLDLLLEVFPRHPELHLHVCSQFADEPDFCDIYRKELFETPNVHPVGFIEVNGPRFNELAARCAWTVYPTCSDGQAGSIVQCMHAGLVPLVTPAAGIDAEDFGLLFATDEIAEVERAVLEAAGAAPEWVRERAARTRSVALAEYTAEAFAARWRTIIEEVTADAAVGTAPAA